jgi:hypothetical protein
MLLYGSLLVLLFATSIVSLTAAGGQPPPDTETLLRSPLEQQRFRRDVRLQAVGFTSLAAAALLGLFGLSAGLSMLH